MRWIRLLCLWLALVAAATAQVWQKQIARDLSSRCANYYATLYRVPVELVDAIIEEESGWNPYAVSRKGAAGLMQLMPQTAIRFGVRNRFDIDENVRGGVAYLALLNRMFNRDFRLVTAAYYVGELPVLGRGLGYSSRDVQAYVIRVARRYQAKRRETSRARISRAQ